MRRPHRTGRSEAGSVLIIAVTVLAMITIIGLIALQMATVDLETAGAERGAEGALYIAEAGVQWALQELDLTYEIDPADPDYTEITNRAQVVTLETWGPPQIVGWHTLHNETFIPYGDGGFRVAARVADPPDHDTLVIRSLGVYGGGGENTTARRLLEVAVIPPMMRLNRHHYAGRPTSWGFTLIELMIIVAVISILATLAVGMSGSFRRRNSLRSLSREVYNAANRARGAALRRGSTVHVEITSFAEGRLNVFIDTNADDLFTATSDVLLYQYPIDDTAGAPFAAQAGVGETGVFPFGMTVTPTSVVTGINEVGAGAVLLFDSSGFAVDMTGEPWGGTIVVADANLGGDSYSVDVTIAGALRIR